MPRCVTRNENEEARRHLRPTHHDHSWCGVMRTLTVVCGDGVEQRRDGEDEHTGLVVERRPTEPKDLMERTRETTCCPPQRGNNTARGLNKTTRCELKKTNKKKTGENNKCGQKTKIEGGTALCGSPEEPSHLVRALPLAAPVPTGRRARRGSVFGRVQHHADRYPFWFLFFFFGLEFIKKTTDSSIQTIS